jgi:hypothetical protein
MEAAGDLVVIILMEEDPLLDDLFVHLRARKAVPYFFDSSAL